MQNSHTKADMTQGPAMKLVLLFALPICIGNILQQLYTTVDTLVIGNFCDSVSLAAVGTSSQPVEMLLCIFLGIGTGVSILISQYTGSGDGKAVRETAATATSIFYLNANPVSYTQPPAPGTGRKIRMRTFLLKKNKEAYIMNDMSTD